MTWDPTSDAWFAGFVAGEGYFAMRWDPRSGGFVAPRLQIHLRADDAAILHELQQAFGGVIGYSHSTADGRRRAPTCQWSVSAKRDLVGLVRYFDQFALRAKKANDYRLWREAVVIYRSGTGTDPRLRVLRDAMAAGRAFDADAPDVDEPFAPQLALGIEAA